MLSTTVKILFFRAGTYNGTYKVFFGNFEKGIYYEKLKLLVAVHSSFAQIDMLAGRILQYDRLNLKLRFCALYFKIKRK